jgi:hypothetical protein
MKFFLAALATLMSLTLQARAADSAHRYVVESATPPSAAVQAKTNDASFGVHWLRSYTNADKTQTYSLYEGPSEAAVRKAAALNSLTLTNINEAPVDLDSETDASPGNLPAGMHRYMVERTFPAGALDGLDSATKAKVNSTNSKNGAQWVTSYANSSKTKTYCVYNAADEAAVRAAAKANGLPVDKITEVPLTAAAK